MRSTTSSSTRRPPACRLDVPWPTGDGSGRGVSARRTLTPLCSGVEVPEVLPFCPLGPAAALLLGRMLDGFARDRGDPERDRRDLGLGEAGPERRHPTSAVGDL